MDDLNKLDISIVATWTWAEVLSTTLGFLSGWLLTVALMLLFERLNKIRKGINVYRSENVGFWLIIFLLAYPTAVGRWSTDTGHFLQGVFVGMVSSFVIITSLYWLNRWRHYRQEKAHIKRQAELKQRRMDAALDEQD